MAVTICRMEESSPPGVSMVSRTSAAPSWFAAWMPPEMESATKGSTTPVRFIDTMTGSVPEAARAAKGEASIKASPVPRTINRAYRPITGQSWHQRKTGR